MKNFGVSTAAVTCLFTALAALIVGLRVHTRLRLSKNFGLDDVVIVFSLVLNIIVSAMYSYSVSLGTGQHISMLSPEQAEHAVRIEVITNSILDQTFAWPKLSVVILLCRVFEPKIGIRITGYTLVVICIMFSCLITIFNYTQCSPDSGFWNHDEHARCWPAYIFSDFAIGTCSYSAALDLALAVYPAFALRGMNMGPRRKVMLSCLMGLGVVASIAAIIKVVQLGRLKSHEDLTYSFAHIDLWNMIEANLLVMTASIPTLGPLWRSWKPARAFIRETTVWPGSKRYRTGRKEGTQLPSIADCEAGGDAVQMRDLPAPQKLAAEVDTTGSSGG